MFKTHLAILMLAATTAHVVQTQVQQAASTATETRTLKSTFKGIFRFGAALNPGQFEERDARGNPIVAAHFDSISPENALKWGYIHPRPDTYNFGPADRFVEFGAKHKMFTVGHCLVWHSQTPVGSFRILKATRSRGNRYRTDARTYPHGGWTLQGQNRRLGRGE